MSYQLLYTKSAFNDIKKFDIFVKKIIKKRLEQYYSNPLANAKKLINTAIDSYRWRVGNYRIVFDLDDKKIIVLRIGHRKEIYK